MGGSQATQWLLTCRLRVPWCAQARGLFKRPSVTLRSSRSVLSVSKERFNHPLSEAKENDERPCHWDQILVPWGHRTLPTASGDPGAGEWNSDHLPLEWGYWCPGGLVCVCVCLQVWGGGGWFPLVKSGGGVRVGWGCPGLWEGPQFRQLEQNHP